MSFPRSAGWLAEASIVVLIVGPVGSSAAAQGSESTVFSRSVELIPAEGTTLTILDRRYRGVITVAGHSDGLALTEQTTVDAYLEGIAEVPFEWEPAALEAQVVAARTYLAWTLGRGRTASGRRYGYDICATTACQVYAGAGLVEGPLGRRWQRAIEATANEVLVYGAGAAQTLYSSTSAGRTSNVEDVFPGATPQPYLVAVDSPGEESPFVEWEFTLSGSQTQTLLTAAGVAKGVIERIDTSIPADGAGSRTIRVVSNDADTTTGTWELRTLLNRAAGEVLADVLPAERPDGRRYPQTILSPVFEVVAVPGWIFTYVGPPIYNPAYTLRGRGWGHNVGMSQYGAQAMATAGAGYREILAHYYGGLEPQPAGGLLPETVAVGLSTELADLVVEADGPVTVSADGAIIGDLALGSWMFEASEGGVLVEPPTGLGLAPSVGRIRFAGGKVVFDLNTTAVVRIDRGPGQIHPPGVVEETVREGSSVVTISVENPQGSLRVTVRVPRE
jgi:stage II sporulation protein D